MFGASLIKLIKVRDLISAADIPVFAAGFVVSFLSALLVIRVCCPTCRASLSCRSPGIRIFFRVLILILYWNRSAF